MPLLQDLVYSLQVCITDNGVGQSQSYQDWPETTPMSGLGRRKDLVYSLQVYWSQVCITDNAVGQEGELSKVEVAVMELNHHCTLQCSHKVYGAL